MTTTITKNLNNSIIRNIKKADAELEGHFAKKLVVTPELTRALVSFQANKKSPGYRWFKFKEGFSSALVNYVFDRLGVKSGKVLDPFAGSGATLFTASSRGLNAFGIEVLPIGCEVIKARKQILRSRAKIVAILDKWSRSKPWRSVNGSNGNGSSFNHLRITNGAFPKASERFINSYLGRLHHVGSHAGRTVLRFALLSILEEISYTRKDGQYLRWDHRSGRRQGAKRFDKGTIKDFEPAILEKLNQILSDLQRQPDWYEQQLCAKRPGKVEVKCGSCLEELPRVPANTFSALMTSPPYCNRYDYTRTYALELALLGVGEERLRNLRQQMLTCTVENREKSNLDSHLGKTFLRRAEDVFGKQTLLALICKYLDEQRQAGLLNNNGIARMVKNYFWEMTLVILQCARVLKPGAPFIMVNDNVRYAGIPIPVDLILSRIAEYSGFEVETIWVLPRGKGNSSQQMGEHGREELRKCVYVWRVARV